MGPYIRTKCMWGVLHMYPLYVHKVSIIMKLIAINIMMLLMLSAYQMVWNLLPLVSTSWVVVIADSDTSVPIKFT